MLNYFLVFATLWFVLLSVIWHCRDWVNLTIKLAFIVMSITGLIVTAQTFGYLIRTPT